MRKYALLFTSAAALLLVGAGCYGSSSVTLNEPSVNANANAQSGDGRAVLLIKDDSTMAAGASAVVVTVDKVEMHSEAQGWVTVSSTAKTYDLLQLKKASVAKLLADATVAAGTYDQVRLDISKVEVTANGKVQTAKLPSSVLRIVGNFTVAADQTSTATLDFDVDKSLHVTGTGLFILAPVVRLTTEMHAQVKVETDESVEVESGDTETDKTVGSDETGETKDDFELPAKLDIDASGHIMVKP